MNDDSYNLVTQRWVPCVLPDGSVQHLGLFDTLARADELREVLHSSPLVTVALHRLLLAILHRVFGPANLDAWGRLWVAGRWDAEALQAYFARWDHRFDLFHPERPFYQVAHLDDAETHPIALLAHELASGNNPTLFDHHHEEAITGVEPGEAACYLLAFQSYAIGFGKSKPFYFSDTPLVRGLSVLMLGRNLFETLALNLMAYNDERPIPWNGADQPAWEQDDTAEPDGRGNVPRGYLDYLTWQSRRIQLSGAPSQTPGAAALLVTHCRVRQNLKLPESGVLDPMKSYRNIPKQGLLPVGPDEDRALWRQYHSLLEFRGEEYRRPECFNWIARAKQQSLVATSLGASLLAAGLATETGKAAKVRLWRHERLPLPLDFLDDPDLLERVRFAIDRAETGEWVLTEAVRSFARYALMPQKQDGQEGGKVAGQPSKEIDQLVRALAPAPRYWSQLELPFLRLIERLAQRPENTPEPATHRERCLADWTNTVRLTAASTFRQTMAKAGSSGRCLKAAVRAEADFRRLLNRKVPISEVSHAQQT